ncbi:MAG: zinc ABC transporter substrate-binding protein [Mycobacterium sp.]
MRRLLFCLVAAVAALSACGPSPDRSDKISVVASTNVWGSVAAAVGGDFVQVRSIIDDPAQDPHSYDASPADAAALSDAQLVVYNGGGYDGFAEKVLAQHGTVSRVDAFTVGGHQRGSNPHVFYDLGTVALVADAIARQLGAADPTHGADYTSNAQRFTAGIDDIEATQRAVAAAHPGAVAIATEDIAEYLETATGLTDKTPEGYLRAVAADTDPPPADIAAVLDVIDSHDAQVVLFNPQTETSVTRRIVDAANAGGVPVVEVRETLPAGSDFLSWQRHTVEQLSAALQATDVHTP